jgi:putative flippase GtrA
MLKKIMKFAVTGGLGTLTNLILFAIFADILKFEAHAVNVACFLVSCTQNYIINHLWTFKVENQGESLSVKLWAKFLAGSLVGYAVNFGIFCLLLHLSNWEFVILEKNLTLKVIPQGIGILAGMVFNFIFSNFIVFNKIGTNDERKD